MRLSEPWRARGISWKSSATTRRGDSWDARGVSGVGALAGVPKRSDACAPMALNFPLPTK